MTTAADAGRAREGPVSLAEVVALGVAMALATGLIESTMLFFTRNLLDRFTWTGADAYWLTPLSYLMLFAPLIGVLAVLATLAPRVGSFRVVLFLLLWLSVLSLTFQLVHRRIALVTQVILAAGIATAIVRGAMPRQAAWLRGARRLSLELAAISLALAATPLVRTARERWVLAHLPAARDQAPSVLLIIFDTVRAASLGLYGGPATSAGLDRWAARGVVFDHAYATASWTLPSHASMFTGAFPHALSAGWEETLDDARPTLAEAFAAAGYRTGGFVGNLYYTSDESGLSRGFARYREYRLSRYQLFLSSALGQLLEEIRTGGRPARRANERKRAPWVSAEAEPWLEQGQRPFFAFLNYFDAHLPYQPEDAWRGRFPESNRRLELYEESIAGLDANVDSLLGALERSGRLRNTIVVVTADHGESVGEHGLNEHGWGLYVQDLHVPLVIFGPGVPQGIRVPETVSLADLGATIADAARLPATFAGHSFAGLWRGAPPANLAPALAELEMPRRAPPNWPVSHGPMRSLIAGGFHLILRGDGVPELFDLTHDATEEHDLAADPRQAGRLQGMRAALERVEGHGT